MDLLFAWLSGSLGSILGLATGRKVLVPLVQVFLFWPLWLDRTLASQDLAHSTFLVLAWAFGATLALIPATRLFPDRLEALVLKGTSYRDEMFAWIRTGRGPEAHPRRMFLLHLRQCALYAALALLTANALSLLLGAILLNYMNFYVGSLFLHARRPLVILLLGWNVWSLLRVAAFCTLGAALGTLSLAFLQGANFPAHWTPLLLAALVGLLLDPLLKIQASPPAARALSRATNLPLPRLPHQESPPRFAPTLQGRHHS